MSTKQSQELAQYLELVHLFRRMRAAQVSYFKDRCRENLQAAMALENQIDNLLSDMQREEER